MPRKIRQRASYFAAEVADLQGKVDTAMRDAQRSHEGAENSNRTIAVLEHRLAKCTMPYSSNKIPNRQIGDMGSISTALSETRVRVSKQQMEINDLKRHLEQVKAGGTRPADETLREVITTLRRTLDAEKRARTEDQLRWDKRTRELEAENRKLTISRSNAAIARGGGMRKPTHS